MKRILNFSAGPGMLPLEVLRACAESLVNYEGKGFGIAECSHRNAFGAVLEEATERCKALLGLGDTHDILFFQGGATQLFLLVPMNLGSVYGMADYMVGGEWSKKASNVAKKISKVNIVASSEATNFDHSPLQNEWELTSIADYLHVCSNETVHGHCLVEWPKHPNLIVDASSEFMSRPHPINDCALVYAGAQKNLGPAGVVLCIVRKDMYNRIPKSLPDLWNFQKQAEAKSMINTPPTFGVYCLLEMFRWLEKQGGLTAMEKRNTEKAGLIYNAIDNSGDFYKGTVSMKEQRSHMNITFRLPTEELNKMFLNDSSMNDMMGLKGYRTVGGVRASIYNAMPLEGCQVLANFMRDFASKNG